MMTRLRLLVVLLAGLVLFHGLVLRGLRRQVRETRSITSAVTEQVQEQSAHVERLERRVAEMEGDRAYARTTGLPPLRVDGPGKSVE